MEVRVICFLSVVACAVMTSCAVTLPAQPSQEPSELETSDKAQALQWLLNSMLYGSNDDIVIDDDDADDDGEGEEMFSRRRRLMGGMHSRFRGRVYRGRPRVHVRRGHTGYRSRARNNLSPY